MLQAKNHGENGGDLLNMAQELLLALGANMTSPRGGPETTLRSALEMLEKQGVTIRKTSRFYRTPAFPAGNGPDYVNAAVSVITPWSAPQTLAKLHQIEAQMGRTRGTRWGQRTLDLDLIAQGDLVLPDAQTHAEWRDLPLEQQISRTPEQLILPHPRLQDRAFVLVPLADVAPDWVHPVLGQSVTQMCAALSKKDLEAVKPLQ